MKLINERRNTTINKQLGQNSTKCYLKQKAEIVCTISEIKHGLTTEFHEMLVTELWT